MLIARCDGVGGTCRFTRRQAERTRIFVRSKGSLRLIWGKDDPSLDQALWRRAQASMDAPPLHRLTLPVAEARRLLRLLSFEGVDGASMFPGADGVVRAMRERALWDGT